MSKRYLSCPECNNRFESPIQHEEGLHIQIKGIPTKCPKCGAVVPCDINTVDKDK